MPRKTAPPSAAYFAWPEAPVAVTGDVTYYHSILRESGGRQTIFHVGDVALFEADAGLPPFVGLLERLSEQDGEMMVTARWFYRPQDAVKVGATPPHSHRENEIYLSGQVRMGHCGEGARRAR